MGPGLLLPLPAPVQLQQVGTGAPAPVRCSLPALPCGVCGQVWLRSPACGSPGTERGSPAPAVPPGHTALGGLGPTGGEG